MRNLCIRAITLALLSLLLAAPVQANTAGYRLSLSFDSHFLCDPLEPLGVTANVEDNGNPVPGHTIHFEVIPYSVDPYITGGYFNDNEDEVETDSNGDANTLFHSCVSGPDCIAGCIYIKATDLNNNHYVENWVIVTDPTAPIVHDDGVWTKSMTTLHASWELAGLTYAYSQPGSQYAIGTSSGATDVTDGWINVGANTEVTRSDLTLTDGDTYYFAVKRTITGCPIDTGTSDGITVDAQVPTISTCTETPAISSGQVTINYTGATDTGASGLLGVGLYEVDGEQYTLVDARTASSDSFTLTYTGNGTVDNLVLRAWDNAGNRSADKTVPTFTIDQTAPSQPSNVVMSHVLPTSRYIHATWDAATDANGIQNYSYQFWFTTSSGGPYALTNVLVTTGTYATYDLGGYLSVDPTIHIGVRVWARDNAGNVGNYADSTGVSCNKVQVGFLYYKCETGTAYTYSDVRWYIDFYLNNVKYYGPCVGNVTYTKISSAPTTTSDYASYDVLFVALPASDFTSTESGAIQSFVSNQGFNKRLVLAGEYGKTSYGDGYSTYNTRLNTLASSVNLTTRFHANENTQDSYPSDQGISYRDCPVRSHYLTNGVGALWNAGPSTFAAYVNPIAALRDGESAYPGQFWVVEEDIPQSCSVVCVHDCGMFLFEYDNTLQSPNLVGHYEVDYDYVPDRNFRFVENLYTVFPH